MKDIVHTRHGFQLDPGGWDVPNFAQFGHGEIKLTVLFNDPADPE